jgi:hypothetical protein
MAWERPRFATDIVELTEEYETQSGRVDVRVALLKTLAAFEVEDLVFSEKDTTGSNNSGSLTREQQFSPAKTDSFRAHVKTLIRILQQWKNDLSTPNPTVRYLCHTIDELARYGEPTSIQTICTRVIKYEEKRLAKDKVRSPSWSAYSNTLVPVIDACLFIDDISLLKRALRCLRGAPLEIFAELRRVLRSIPFEHLVEG